MHVVQVSPEDVACMSCDRAIVEGELRLSEEVVGDDGKFARSLRYARTPRRRESYDEDDRRDEYAGPSPELSARYYHLACAATHVPMRLSPALAQCPLPIANRDELGELMRKAVARERSAIDPAAEDEATRPEYERFVAQLREATDDEGQVVFGDWLQTVDDPRGQLIAIQLQLESATGWTKDRLVETERKLLAAHRQLLPGKNAALVWRRGFVHAISSGVGDGVLQHPSLQLVRELRAHTFPEALPPTLRILEIANWTTGNLKALLPLVQLRRLALPLDAPLVGLQHPTLAELELAASQVPARCELPTQLPALRRLTLRVPNGLAGLIETLAHSTLLASLDELVLVGHLEVSHLKPLKRTLTLLDLRGTPLAHTDLDAVKGLATTVELPPPPPEKTIKAWRVRHTKRREWGIGRVVEETEQGLVVEFEEAGEKLVRNVELLEDIE